MTFETGLRGMLRRLRTRAREALPRDADATHHRQPRTLLVTVTMSMHISQAVTVTNPYNTQTLPDTIVIRYDRH